MNITPFNVEVEPLRDDVSVVLVKGELDQANAGDLRRPLLETISAGTHAVMIDLTDCGFVDSTGLGVIVEAWKILQDRNGNSAALTICCPEPEVRRLLEVTGLDQAIMVRESRDEAIAPLLA
jgi:anti-sigma B factor antagonist